MQKSAEEALAQLKTAVSYFIGLLEDGTLIGRYDATTRSEIAMALTHLLHKVETLPANVPERLMQAAAVRAIIEAAEAYDKAAKLETEEAIALHMRQVEAAATVRGHVLGVWEQVPSTQLEYQISCLNCAGFVYISHKNIYNLLLDSCERVHIDTNR